MGCRRTAPTISGKSASIGSLERVNNRLNRTRRFSFEPVVQEQIRRFGALPPTEDAWT
jgi:hypothetical protein